MAVNELAYSENVCHTKNTACAPQCRQMVLDEVLSLIARLSPEQLTKIMEEIV